MPTLIDLRQKVPMSLDQGLSVLQGTKSLIPSSATLYAPTVAMARTTNSVRVEADYGTYKLRSPDVDLWFVGASVVMRKQKPSDWLEANGAALSRYAGEWLLISTDGVLAHSTSYQEIRSVLQQTKPVEYITYYVPRPDEANFRL
jgi:hypothetical protein